MTHRHICGVRAMFPREEPPANVRGCGYVWEHPRNPGDSNRTYRDKHMCPNCNMGPWYAICNENEGVLSPPIPRVAFGRVVRPADDNLAYLDPSELKDFYAYAAARADIDEMLSGVERLLGDGPMAVAFGKDVIVIDIDNHSISGFNLKERR